MSMKRMDRTSHGASIMLALMIQLSATVAGASGQATPVSPQMSGLIAEVLASNPEIAAARAELAAARSRIAIAGAYADPMLEVGVINAALDPLSLSRENMTMKMLGLSQQLPFPGKRERRRAVASADAAGLALAVEETTNRIVRDLRVAYEDIAANQESQRLLARTRAALEQLAATAKVRYDVGEAAQTDVLDAQTELGRLDIEQQQFVSAERALQSELHRLLGRTTSRDSLRVPQTMLTSEPESMSDLSAAALADRPQLLALEAIVDRDSRSVELAQREFYPDFNVSLQYGQRDRAPNGAARDDMISVAVAVNLPIWRKSRLEPQVAAARARREQARSLLREQQLQTQASLESQLALEQQWRDTTRSYQTTLLPLARGAVAAALAAYRVGRVDFLTARQTQLRELEMTTRQVEAIANHNKALAEIDLLRGRRPQ